MRNSARRAAQCRTIASSESNSGASASARSTDRALKAAATRERAHNTVGQRANQQAGGSSIVELDEQPQRGRREPRIAGPQHPVEDAVHDSGPCRGEHLRSPDASPDIGRLVGHLQSGPRRSVACPRAAPAPLLFRRVAAVPRARAVRIARPTRRAVVCARLLSEESIRRSRRRSSLAQPPVVPGALDDDRARRARTTQCPTSSSKSAVQFAGIRTSS